MTPTDPHATPEGAEPEPTPELASPYSLAPPVEPEPAPEPEPVPEPGPEPEPEPVQVRSEPTPPPARVSTDAPIPAPERAAAPPPRISARQSARPSTPTRSTPATAAAPSAAPAVRKTRERTGLRRAGRILTGALVLALAGGVAAGGALLTREPVATSEPLAVAVPPTQVALACPGPVVAPDGVSTSTDGELGGTSQSQAAVRALVVARDDSVPTATLGPIVAADGAAPIDLLGTGGIAIGDLPTPAGSTVLRAEPSQGAAAFAVAGSVSRADSGDLRGLTSVACPAAATSSWLVGGTTLVGASATLSLRNVGSTAATVSLRAWDAVGEVPVSGTSTLVPPGAQVDQALEASVPDVERLAILVTATGGQVSSTIQTSQLNGLTPAGTDVVAPTTAPALTQLVPGVVLTSTTVDEPDPSLVRIVNPGEAATTVHLDLLGPDGSVRLTDEAGLVVESNAVADVSLAGAPAGTFTVRVTADDPVAAGAQLVRRGEPAPEDPDVPVLDRAWLPAVEPAASAAVTVPGLGSLTDRAVLVLGNAEDDTATVTVTALDATGVEVAEREVPVPAAGSTSLELSALGTGVVGLVLDANAPVSSGVVLTWNDALGEMISVLAAQPDPQVDRSAAVTLSGS